ncbi:MAG: toll/interleukin-1 receptor domain-containing protein [Prolixibacteraceae bacterium]|nr:toll/interleukin-1 receptor domain-containing protein [Prolixibacteraceae bacterium]
MKVFLSWSGERSRQVAELLDEWLQCVIQAVTPWMSSKDIDRGALWFSEITDQLANTGIGVICLTKENKIKPWILFEAGALAKGISSNRVCTLLIDLKPEEVKNPLAQFNHSKPNKNGIWELVRTINLSLKEDSLKESILEKVFNTYWEQFDTRFKEILKNTPENGEIETRSENDMLLEVLSSIRSMDRRMRRIEDNDSYKSFSDKRRVYLTADGVIPDDDLENEILKMLNNRMPKELIIDILEDKYKLSRNLIFSKLNKLMVNINKE